MQVSTIFSKNVLEKPRLVYTYNVRYFVCSFIRRDRFAIQLRFLSQIPLWFTWEWTIFQTFKMSHSLLFPIKNSPSPPLPTQYCYVCFKECLLLSKKVRKIKPNIKYRGKEGKKQNTVTYLFFFSIFMWKIIRHLCYLTNIKTQYNSKSTYYENEVIFAFTKNFCWGQTRETE